MNINNLGGRRRTIMKQRAALLLQPREAHEEKQEVVEQPQEVPVLKGPKLCPKCGKAKAYYFHVKNCKGA